MKIFENKETDLPLDNKRPGPATYFYLAQICVNSPPANGMSVGEIEKRLRVIRAIFTPEPEAQLEDADFDTLKACFEDMRWLSVSQALVDFVNYIRQGGKQENAVGVIGG